MILLARSVGVVALILAGGTFFIDIQLSRYEHGIVLRSFRDIFEFFGIRSTEAWNFGLMPESPLWTLIGDPLLSTPVTPFLILLGILLLAVGLKAPKLTQRNLFRSESE